VNPQPTTLEIAAGREITIAHCQQIRISMRTLNLTKFEGSILLST
jgi:hypothetical protein